MEKKPFLNLIGKYLAGQASVEEEQQLISFFESFQANEAWDEEVMGVKSELEEKMLNRLMQSVQHIPAVSQPEVRIRPVALWRNIAAAIIILIIAGTAFFKLNHRAKPNHVASLAQPALLPGGNKALLKLANGSTIVLNKAANGVLAMQGNIAVRKTQDGQLVYQADKADKSAGGASNTIITPKGGKYELTLSDGTKVWLNAESSLTFPTVFNSNERHVELKGEAYFEVAKVYTNTPNGKVRMPFYVQAKNTKVEVLGTHFNVMAYDDAPDLKATLLEGSVMVKHGNNTQKITPGQQASIVNGSNAPIEVRTVKTESVMAWKDDLFLFDNTDIVEAMQQIKRWYNADVVYEGVKPDVQFTGVLPRSSEVTKVLSLLESAQGVKFTIDGNRIIVEKK